MGDLLHHFRGMVAAHPELSVEVRNPSVGFYEGCASVWCLLEIGGGRSAGEGELGGGLARRREADAVLFWERVRKGGGTGGVEGERWVCTRDKGLRGVLSV